MQGCNEDKNVISLDVEFFFLSQWLTQFDKQVWNDNTAFISHEPVIILQILHWFLVKWTDLIETSLSNSTEKENILMFACLFLVMKCFPHCQHVAASFCFVHLEHSWMSVSLRTSPRIQEAHFTHPCFGFGLTPRQRSKYNTQNPPSHQPPEQHSS